MQEQEKRLQAYITALYLSKCGTNPCFSECTKTALKELQCKTWNQAYTKIGQILGYEKASIKNYRDYFDAFFPNERKGWTTESTPQSLINIYKQFGNFDCEYLSTIVKNILEGKYLFTIYDPPSISNLSFAEKERLQQAYIEEQLKNRKDRDPKEYRYVIDLLEQEGGEKEVAVIDSESKNLVGLVDLITYKEVIEVKNIQNWKHAVGQIFTYWYYLSLNTSLTNNNLIPRIHLFGGKGVNDERIKQCASVMNKVFSPYVKSPVVTYAEDEHDLDWDEL